MTRFFVSAAVKSSGKTTVSIGLAAAHRRARPENPDLQEGAGLYRSDVARPRFAAEPATISTSTPRPTTKSSRFTAEGAAIRTSP